MSIYEKLQQKALKAGIEWLDQVAGDPAIDGPVEDLICQYPRSVVWDLVPQRPNPRWFAELILERPRLLHLDIADVWPGGSVREAVSVALMVSIYSENEARFLEAARAARDRLHLQSRTPAASSSGAATSRVGMGLARMAAFASTPDEYVPEEPSASAAPRP